MLQFMYLMTLILGFLGLTLIPEHSALTNWFLYIAMIEYIRLQVKKK